MSKKFALALATLIGASIAISSTAQARPELVEINGEYAPGTIVVRTNERRLYLILDTGHAMRYPVGVGKAGKQWEGTTKIDGKYLHPAWSPPDEVRRDKPNMPDIIPGGSPRIVQDINLNRSETAVPGTPRTRLKPPARRPAPLTSDAVSGYEQRCRRPASGRDRRGWRSRA